MKRILALLLALCCLASLQGCSKDEILGRYNSALRAAGEAVLTDSGALQGRRVMGEDSYVGSYEAEYEGFSGRELLFGGTGLEREGGNMIRVSGSLVVSGGTLRLLFKSGANEPAVLCDASGAFSTSVKLPSASNYILVEAEDFTGSLSLRVE